MVAPLPLGTLFRVFKYSEDRLPIGIILLLSALDFALYFLLDNTLWLVLFWLIMIVPKSSICAWNHHHQHTSTFRFKPLNRLLEFFYALHTGVTTNLWVLHHVLGHHHNYLDQSKDESRWQRKDGSKMGEIEYSFDVAATAYYRGYQVGKCYPKIQTDFLIYTATTFMLVALMTWYRPIPALFIFVLPMIGGLLMTAWVTYEHHSGLDTQNEWEASFNNTNRLFNILTGNLGYHTAHHHKQGMHWSQLPDLHSKIKHHIPASLIKTTLT